MYTSTIWDRLTRPIKGAKGQLYLQLGVATSMFLSFVVAPVWYEAIVKYRKKFIKNDDLINNREYIHNQVYLKRLELRELAQKLLAEEKNKRS